MPGSVSDVLDAAHHHIFHNAFPAGVRRYGNLQT